DAGQLIATIAGQLSQTRIQAILNAICHCREQLLNVTGINRELVLTDLLLQIEHYLQPGTVLPVPHL
ncbi:MAG: DNA polymerase III subunit delta' C-terminal domain-containing protein, partial [Citrobacter sp.]|nr:DNA polymerase III subunit delta' C-terminal domain-containing protein [Citrobacter sp.]